MNELKKILIERAISAHEKIYPCSNYNSLEESFTVEDRALLFWFNTEDQSTHVIVEDFQ